MKNNPEQKLDFFKLRKLLNSIYHDHDSEELDFVFNQLLKIIQDNQLKIKSGNNLNVSSWDQSHCVLIAYADSVQKNNECSLITLERILSKYLLPLSKVLHILPFLKSTSDGGFAVSSHELIEERFGDWINIKTLSKNHILMADLVLNHVSSSHPWVQQFIKNEEPGLSNIFAPPKQMDWDQVTRPRSSSLFSQINTIKGQKYVWTTFGPDQVDLNWQNPRMIIEFMNLIVKYVSNGIKWLRLDAVGFIWKEEGTTCLHLPKAHQLVKILKIQLFNLLSDGVLITETNVPQRENLSYLMPKDEAHMAYNFPLPPLLLEAVITSKVDLLNNWISNWPSLPSGTTMFNFTASHDGVGLRALEGLMDDNRLKELLINCEKRGGLISHRRLSNGEDKPYELNISWWSAMEDSSRVSNRFQYQRFILTQLLVISLQGVPAFYLPALFASNNDIKSFSMTGQRRDLNREKFKYEELSLILQHKESNASRNINFLSKAMEIRANLKAFHPSSEMECLTKDRSDLTVIKRGKNESLVLAIHNFTENKLNYSINDSELLNLLSNKCELKDYLTDKKYSSLSIVLEPFEVIWLGV